MSTTPTTKLVNGVVVELTPEEISQTRGEWAAAESVAVEQSIIKQIKQLESLVTCRLMIAAMTNDQAVISHPGTIIDGLTASDAVAAIKAAGDELRAQLTTQVLYQSA